MDLYEHLKSLFLRHKGLFISGTDTGIGKTYVGCLIAKELRDEGLDVGVFKPAQSGSGDDAGSLAKAAGSQDERALYNPYQLKAALAPGVAARMEKRKISLKKVSACFKTLQARHQGVIVEGAGGLMVPIDGKFMVADLAQSFKLPLVLVARPALGTLNHSLLSIRELERRGIKLACVILNGLKGRGGLAEQSNPKELARLAGIKVAGPLAWGCKTLKKQAFVRF